MATDNLIYLEQNQFDVNIYIERHLVLLCFILYMCIVCLFCLSLIILLRYIKLTYHL